MKRISVILCLIPLLYSCLKAERQDAVFRKHIVVEGRIEQGRGAEVMLTLNKGFSESFTEEDLQDIVIRWAKVTISDSCQSEILTGRYNRDYPTRFIYTSSLIRGEAGKTYTLTVEYGGGKWTATTSIPSTSASLSDIRAGWVSDSLYRITANLIADRNGNSCMIECCTGAQATYFRPSPLGIVNGSGQNADRRITVNRPIDYTRISSYTTLFRERDTVNVRLLTMSRFGYEYWSMWENNVINSLNPIFPADSNLPTNISGNGTGIWCGYGASYYRVLPPAK